MKGKIHIGTSGWHYDHWKGQFYPPGTREKDFLSYYINFFKTVEINNSFYHLPDEKTVRQWRRSVPEGFVFSVKASRYITHRKRLKDPGDNLSKFLDIYRLLEDRGGPILFQLPPRWHCNIERLENFLDILPFGHSYTFEFRDPAWFNDQVYNLLRKYECAFCIFDLNGSLSPKEVTTDFVYIRLHGPGDAYQGSYDQPALNQWANDISAWSYDGKDVYCYFDNDQAGYAVKNALELKNMIANK